MEPVATSSEFVASGMENPAIEIQDFEKVVHFYWPKVFRFLLVSVRDRDVAESLTQDCFVNAYRGRTRFRGDSSVNTWLMHIAINLVRDFARNRRLQFWRRASASAIDASKISEWIPNRDVSPERRALIQEQLGAVWQATHALSEKQRTVFLLRFVEDMELREIAVATGMKEGAVKTHLYRALHAIRHRIRRSE